MLLMITVSAHHARNAKKGDYPVEDLVITILSEKYDSCTSFRRFLQYPLMERSISAGNLYKTLTEELPAYKYCLLHVISYSGLANVFAHLLKSSKHDINVKAGFVGSAPLTISAKHGHTDLLMQILIQTNVDANTVEERGMPPISSAALNSYTAVVNVLPHHNAEIDLKDTRQRTPLFWAAQSGHTDALRLLLKHGAEVNSQDVTGRTPLSIAAECGRIRALELLLQQPGVNVNTVDRYGMTPLSSAARYRHMAEVRLPLKQDTDVNSMDSMGCTPLHSVAEYNHTEMLKVLLEGGADPNAKSSSQHFSYTPLHYAVKATT